VVNNQGDCHIIVDLQTILGGKSEYFLITDYSTHYFDRLMSMIICYQKVLTLNAKNCRK